MRWFSSEYLIVVAGVLTAFALSAWWQSYQDSARERNYLEQLRTELLATESLMNDSDSLSSSWEVAQAKFIRAFYLEELTPTDSLYRWVGEGVFQPDLPSPVLATAKGLISTGDLGLLVDDHLKFEISKYVEFSERTVEVQLRYFDYFFDAVRPLADNLSRARMQDAYQPFRDLAPESETRFKYPDYTQTERFPTEAADILSNRVILNSMVDIDIAHANARNLRDKHRVSAIELRRLIERQLGID